MPAGNSTQEPAPGRTAPPTEARVPATPATLKRSRRQGILLACGFGLLVGLIGVQGLFTRHVMRRAHVETVRAQTSFWEVVAALARIEAKTYESGILWRDYLAEPDSERADELRESLLALRGESRNEMERLAGLVAEPREADLEALRRRIETYWDSLKPVLRQAGREQPSLDLQEFRRRRVAERLQLLTTMREFEKSHAAAFQREQERLNRAQVRDTRALQASMIGALAVALTVASLTVMRNARLEKRSEEQRLAAERARSEMRRLSAQLIRGQEDERRTLSRELHDEIGQKLTAIRIDLGRLDRAKVRGDDEFRSQLEETKGLVETSLQAVRDLAMGLRPSMLDDLGLEAALEWQGRDFSRRTGIAVRVEFEPAPELPDPIGTCLFRVVQEALTNCARHARAEHVVISLRPGEDRVELRVEDDGMGIDSEESGGRGLGLLGIEERVRELGGTLDLSSKRYIGTTLTVQVPLGAG